MRYLLAASSLTVVAAGAIVYAGAEPGRTVILEFDDDDDTDHIHHELRPAASAAYGLLIDRPGRPVCTPDDGACRPGAGRAAATRR